LGAKIGVMQNQVQQELEANAINEREQAEMTVQDRYLAVVFLLNSDKNRYGALIWDIENDYTRGT
jgi:hypothetical protein